MPLIIPANSASASGYTIDNSCRFNVASSDSLTKSFGSAGNRAVWTWSAWIKVGGDAGFNGIFTAGDWTGGSTATGIILYNNQFYIYWNSPAGGTSPSAKFRDPSAWYHVVLTANTSTLKLYVNSVEYASKSISGSGEINNASSEQAIGKYSNGSSTFNGYMSEVCFIDGTAYAPTDFGKFDEDSEIWKPIDVSGLTFGTNGFYLDFKDSAALGDDVSGNGNDFTVNNLTAIDQTTDTPTNNFATMNALGGYGTFSEGNLKFVTSTTDGQWGTSTISLSSGGKWYCEVKMIATSDKYQVGLTNNNAQEFTYRVVYRSDGVIYVGGSSTSGYTTYTTNDIIGMAFDSLNREITFYKNGSSVGTVTAPALASSVPQDYFFGATSLSSGTLTTEWNFGNPPYSISSGNADGNGYGNFEYSVPSGYYSLNTKNLAEFG